MRLPRCRVQAEADRRQPEAPQAARAAEALLPAWLAHCLGGELAKFRALKGHEVRELVAKAARREALKSLNNILSTPKLAAILADDVAVLDAIVNGGTYDSLWIEFARSQLGWPLQASNTPLQHAADGQTHAAA